MKTRRFLLSIISAGVLPVLLPACATIMTGTTDDVTLTSEPSGASVRIEPDPKELQTPATLTLRRRDGPFLLSFELEGYESQRAYIRSKPNGWLWANILLGGVVGIVVDWSTGAVTRLDPTEVHLVFQPAQPVADEPIGGRP